LAPHEAAAHAYVANVGAEVGEAVGAVGAVGNDVGNEVGAAIGEAVGAGVGDAVGGQVVWLVGAYVVGTVEGDGVGQWFPASMSRSLHAQ
jgi:hypothetical protein